MSDFDGLPDAWTVWSDEDDGRAVLAYRPDVFDTQAFPAACLPTLYVTRGRRSNRRPGVDRTHLTDRSWYVTLYLEPEVELDETHEYETRTAAVEGAVALARRFAAGDVDYRGLYQVPRDDYFEKLDELTG